jgi:uncharacterized protein YicC (UPF0701 family)
VYITSTHALAGPTSNLIHPDSRLALRLATAEAHSTQPPPPASPDVPSPSASPANPPSSADLLALRASLASAQTARAALESEVAALSTLRTTNAAQGALLEARSREIASLQRKIRDRNEEIKEKMKLVEQVQDEMVSLNLQLNMAEQKSEKLQAENKHLVERWVKRMGEEVDRMNEESKW